MKLGITFGALAEPLANQLKGRRIGREKMKALQRDADAIVRLNIRGLLPDAQTHAARRRLLKKILEAA